LQGDLQPRGAVPVPDQSIRDDQREGIHGAAGRDAELLVSGTTEVLHRGQQAGLKDTDEGRLTNRHG
jgi:hypothetical protein